MISGMLGPPSEQIRCLARRGLKVVEVLSPRLLSVSLMPLSILEVIVLVVKLGRRYSGSKRCVE